jgi:hypothetical protein
VARVGWTARNEGFDAFLQNPTWQEDPSPATMAPDPDIGADTDDSPIGGSARVGFSKANDIINVEVKHHVMDPHLVRIDRIIASAGVTVRTLLHCGENGLFLAVTLGFRVTKVARGIGRYSCDFLAGLHSSWPRVSPGWASTL